jgi:hypothetical protein
MSITSTESAHTVRSAVLILDGKGPGKGDEQHLKQNEWRFSVLRARQRCGDLEAGWDLVRRNPTRR